MERPSGPSRPSLFARMTRKQKVLAAVVATATLAGATVAASFITNCGAQVGGFCVPVVTPPPCPCNPNQ